MRHFKNCHLARMSDGHYCIIRDLGPVKGGKGLKHHEVVVNFSWQAFVRFVLVRQTAVPIVNSIVLAVDNPGNTNPLRLTPFSKRMKVSVVAPTMPMSVCDIVRR
jgi:hypothetical protein